MKDTRRREIDVGLVWRYDRFARSTQALIRALKEFQAFGVAYGTAWNYAKKSESTP